MQDEPSVRRWLASEFGSERPDLLISIVVAAELVAMVLKWELTQRFSYLNETIGLSFESLATVQLTIGTLSQGIAISAWWLAMLVPHSKRSVWVPLTLLVAFTLLYAALPLYVAVSNFYKWTVFGDELWRVLAWRFASINLQLVCIGSPCYLLSRIGKLQLNRSEDLPRPTTFDVKRILGLTTLIAIAFAAVRWTVESETTSYVDQITPAVIAALSSSSAVSLGIGWACLSWASARRSARWIAIVIVALVLLNSGSAYLTYWLLQNDPNSAKFISVEPNLLHVLLSVIYSLISSLAILAAIRIAKYCGYSLAFAPQVSGNMVERF